MDTECRSDTTPQKQISVSENASSASNTIAGHPKQLPDLWTAATAYFFLGYSIIPLLGDLDPACPKVPAIPWAGFQQHRASLEEQQGWFPQGGFAGLGIVTGRISHLVVLDFDLEDVYQAFKQQFSDLTETHTVRSAGRQLPHLYFKLPDHLHLESQKRAGVDLLSNGRYVVAPPTCIAGQSYKITRGGMPKILTPHDIRRIQAFLNANKLISGSSQDEKSRAIVVIGEKTSPITQSDLHTFYNQLTQKVGRNEALFRTALYSRDAGWSQSQTECGLVALHRQQITTASHHRETTAQRQREAIRTIKSAFSRPARRRPIKKPVSDTKQLPNSAREKLMQSKMTYVVRTIEALLLAGFRPGQVITLAQADRALKGLVGRTSVHNALNAKFNGQAFFTRLPPSYLPEAPNGVASETNQTESNKCFIVTEQIPEIIRKGPKIRGYRIPSIASVCRILGVKDMGSDLLEREDLATAAKTRMALHREMIKRRPARYTRRWLAARMGVSIRTLNTYNLLIPIYNRPQYLTTTIYWSNIERLPLEEALPGTFIETVVGKRYPALRAIAAKLLAKGAFLRLKECIGSFYWFGTEEPPSEALDAIEQYQARKEEAMAAFITKKQPPVTMVKHKPVSLNPPLAPPAVVEQGRAEKKVKDKALLSGYFRKPLADPVQEALANRLYDTLNQGSLTAQKKFSVVTARKLAHTYSYENISQALALLQKRQAIINPVGFLITILRSNTKTLGLAADHAIINLEISK